MAIVFIDRDLEHNHAFADKAFQEASEDKRGKKCIEEERFSLPLLT